MRFNGIEVKFKKAGNQLLVPKPEIQMQVNGKPVQKVRVVAKKAYLLKGEGQHLIAEVKLFTQTKEQVKISEALEVLENYQNVIIDEKANVVKAADVEYFAVQPDGSETQVAPFLRTKEILVPEENWIPSTSIADFEICNVYEVFADDEKESQRLYELAEEKMKKDEIGITTFSFGNGFIQYYVFMVPHFEQGKYVWLAKFSDNKLMLKHLQPIPAAVKVPIKEVPTLSTLPPIQALVATVKK